MVYFIVLFALGVGFMMGLAVGFFCGLEKARHVLSVRFQKRIYNLEKQNGSHFLPYRIVK